MQTSSNSWRRGNILKTNEASTPKYNICVPPYKMHQVVQQGTFSGEKKKKNHDASEGEKEKKKDLDMEENDV